MGAYADGSAKGSKTRAQAIADGKNRKNTSGRSPQRQGGFGSGSNRDVGF